jgi:transcriptional regulator with XRE-family HTH domain
MSSLNDQLIAVAHLRCQFGAEERSLVNDALLAGWSYGDIGSALGISRQAVSKLLASPSPPRRAKARELAKTKERQEAAKRALGVRFVPLASSTNDSLTDEEDREFERDLAEIRAIAQKQIREWSLARVPAA